MLVARTHSRLDLVEPEEIDRSDAEPVPAAV
jgi:hypothetical protein